MIREIEYGSYGRIAPAVSWGAIFAGSFVALALMSSLSLLGAGLGIGWATDSVVFAGGWLLGTGIISFYCGGWVTGHLTRTGAISDSVVHAIVTWAFATTAFVMMLSVGAAAVGGELLSGFHRALLPASNTGIAAGATGIIGFIVLAFEAFFCMLGGRMGTRILKPRAHARPVVLETPEPRETPRETAKLAG